MPAYPETPLAALLSHAAVAFTIEVDNEFERVVPHRTTDHGAPPDNPNAPWLASLVMWQMVLRHVPQRGIATRDLRTATGLSLKEFRIWIARLSTWWDYITIDAGNIVRPTPGGELALAAWPSVIAQVEARWIARHGTASIDRLRAALVAIDRQLPPHIPGHLPILGYGFLTRLPESAAAAGTPGLEHRLPTLFARVLVAFAFDVETATGTSLAVSANLLRIIEQGDAPVRDLPALAGVSKEAVAMALGLLQKSRQITRTLDASHRKILNLTQRGAVASEHYRQALGEIEVAWRMNMGTGRITALRQELTPIVGDGTAANSPLFAGLQPYAASWRAQRPAILTLPHCPMVLHRGGFPDGS